MFDWTKGNIVNKVVFSGLDASAKGDTIFVNSVTNPVTGDEVKRILFKRQGEYFSDRIKNCKVFRTAGYEGTPAKLTIDCAQIEIPQYAEEYEGNVLFQATIKIQMFNKFLGEYANANWALFGKPILVGFEVNAQATPAELAKALYDALYAAVPENNRFMVIDELEEGATEVVCELPDVYADFVSFALESYDPTECESCLGEYNRVKIDEAVTIEHNVEPFATGAWIRENLRFPSYPNMRYAPLYADEQPVPGAVYVMYAFQYQVAGLPGGLNWAGERVASETTHVFYVLASEDAKFQEALEAVDAEIVNNHFHADENEDPKHANPSELESADDAQI